MYSFKTVYPNNALIYDETLTQKINFSQWQEKSRVLLKEYRALFNFSQSYTLSTSVRIILYLQDRTKSQEQQSFLLFTFHEMRFDDKGQCFAIVYRTYLFFPILTLNLKKHFHSWQVNLIMASESKFWLSLDLQAR